MINDDNPADPVEGKGQAAPNSKTSIAITECFRRTVQISIPITEILAILVSKGWEKPTGHFSVSVEQSKAGVPVLRLTHISETPDNSTVYDAPLNGEKIFPIEGA